MKAFDSWVARGANDPYRACNISALWALRDDSDRAVRYLTESCRHLPALSRARAHVDPDFDPIRADQRFAPLLETRPRQP